MLAQIRPFSGKRGEDMGLRTGAAEKSSLGDGDEDNESGVWPHEDGPPAMLPPCWSALTGPIYDGLAGDRITNQVKL